MDMYDALGTDGQRVITSDGLSTQQTETSRVSLPPLMFQTLIDSSTDVGMFYGIYNSSILFPVMDTQGNDTMANRQTLVISNVFAVTVGQNDLTFENLPEPVTIVFDLQKEEGTVSEPILYKK